MDIIEKRSERNADEVGFWSVTRPGQLDLRGSFRLKRVRPFRGEGGGPVEVRFQGRGRVDIRSAGQHRRYLV